MVVRDQSPILYLDNRKAMFADGEQALPWLRHFPCIAWFLREALTWNPYAREKSQVFLEAPPW